MANLTRSDATASTVSSASTPTPTAAASGELQIRIHPRDYIQWRGSRAQLEDEGLLPSDVAWPTGSARSYWSAGGFAFSLFRVAPDVARRGERREWLASGDLWALNRMPDGTHRLDGFASARVYEAQLRLQHALWIGTPEAGKQIHLACVAADDKHFQILMSKMTGRRLSARHARPAKGNRNV